MKVFFLNFHIFVFLVFWPDLSLELGYADSKLLILFQHRVVLHRNAVLLIKEMLVILPDFIQIKLQKLHLFEIILAIFLHSFHVLYFLTCMERIESFLLQTFRVLQMLFYVDNLLLLFFGDLVLFLREFIDAWVTWTNIFAAILFITFILFTSGAAIRLELVGILVIIFQVGLSFVGRKVYTGFVNVSNFFERFICKILLNTLTHKHIHIYNFTDLFRFIIWHM